MTEDLSRRHFMKSTAGAALVATPAIGSALGANDKVKVGWIGVGSRGYHCMDQMYRLSKDKVHVVAVCDTFSGNMARGKDRVQTNEGAAPKTYVDYKDLLADPAVEVVFIMTPEHLHHSMVMAALKANKNIYVEKPLGHTIEEGAEIVRAAEKAGKVVQVGTQNRSNKLYLRAKQMFEDGWIGECHYVRAFWYRNFPSGTTPAPWRYAIPAGADEKNSDWSRFLGPAPKRPWQIGRYYQWRNYWDYSGGISTDLLVHQTDISNFVLGKKVLPGQCMCSGGIYAFGTPDDREVPDTLSAIYEYPDKFHLNYSCFFGNDNFGYGEEFMGNKGTIQVYDRQNLHFSSQPKFIGGAKPFSNHADVHLNYLKDFNQPDATADHILNFIKAVRGEEKNIAPPSVGQFAAIPGHMATLSYRNKKVCFWDHKTEKVRFS